MKIKIVSLNLWNGGRLFDQLQEFLVDQSADLYFLQEAYDGRGSKLADRFKTVELLKKSFPSNHFAFDGFYLDIRKEEGKIEDGNLIISRWPLYNSQINFLDVPYGHYDQESISDFSNFPAGFQKVTVKLGTGSEMSSENSIDKNQPDVDKNTELSLINVHGPVFLDGTANTVRRRALLTALRSNLSGSTILAGDFNAQPSTELISQLSKELTNIFAVKNKVVEDSKTKYKLQNEEKILTTFNTKRKDLKKHPGYASAVVDYIFVSPSIKVLSWQMPKVDISDHHPLVCEVEVK